MKIYLSMISFTNCAFVVVSKKASPYPRLSRFSPVLSSRRFIDFHFTFRSIIYFELLFVKGVRSVSRFIYVHGNVQVFLHHFLKRLSFLHCIAFTPLGKISCDCIYVGLFLVSLFCSIDLFVYSFTNTTQWWLYSKSKLDRFSPLTLFFSFNIVLSILFFLASP